MKNTGKIKKYKTLAGLKRALTRQYNQGTVFYSNNKRTQRFLEDMGIITFCGVSGVGIGFAVGGPQGALIGGVLGLVTGLLVTEKMKIKSIHRDPFGGYTVIFV